MSHQIALLLPHLGGKAYSLRSAIVHAIASLLHKAFDGSGATDTADAQGALARLRSKQHLLDLLCERVRDHSSYTRVAVLQAWEYLAEHRAIPLGHWQMVTGIATGERRGWCPRAEVPGCSLQRILPVKTGAWVKPSARICHSHASQPACLPADSPSLLPVACRPAGGQIVAGAQGGAAPAAGAHAAQPLWPQAAPGSLRQDPG